jgi:hypothetical protein
MSKKKSKASNYNSSIKSTNKSKKQKREEKRITVGIENKKRRVMKRISMFKYNDSLVGLSLQKLRNILRKFIVIKKPKKKG